MRPEAFNLRAAWSIILTSVTVPDSPPFETAMMPKTALEGSFSCIKPENEARCADSQISVVTYF
jgi:hypothetical protein